MPWDVDVEELASLIRLRLQDHPPDFSSADVDGEVAVSTQIGLQVLQRKVTVNFGPSIMGFLDGHCLLRGICKGK